MSTRACIIIKQGDKVYEYYHHYDGYPSYLGSILLNHFNTLDSIQKILNVKDECITLKNNEVSILDKDGKRGIIKHWYNYVSFCLTRHMDIQFIYFWDGESWSCLPLDARPLEEFFNGSLLNDE